MKKLATDSIKNIVYCELTTNEFKTLAKVGQAQVPDGSDVNLAWVKQLSDFATANKVALQGVAAKAQELITSISAIP